MPKKLLSIGVIILFSWVTYACLNSNHSLDKNRVSCNFYYWKTKLDFAKNDKKLADSLGMKKLYVRFFDVDWSPTRDMPVPIAELDPYDDDLQTDNGLYSQSGKYIGDYQLVPVVYLTNRVFGKTFDPDSLAAKVSAKINDKISGITYDIFPSWYDRLDMPEVPIDSQWMLADTIQKQFTARITEIQLDCDWTATTRPAYFAFIEAMKRANPDKNITCTVRLHQFRDREKAGIPPVNAATLMCYNFNSPTGWEVKDAIFDPDLADGYLKKDDYPIALEAALPLFSWGAMFHESEFKGLAAGLSETDVKDNALFKHLQNNQYQFTQDTVFQNVYMREGDVVRLDEASPQELKALAKRLGNIKAVESISFFEWNPTKINQYHVQEIFISYSAAR